MTTGSTIARFTITLSKSVAEPVQVAWNTKDGTAKAGIDYAAASGTAVFSPGETNKDVDVLVYGRAVGTEDRNFFLEMTPPPNAILGESIGECIIYLDTAGNTAVIQVIVPRGPQGAKGDSAYQSWLNLGNTGTEQDFIDSLSPLVEEIAAEVAPILDISSSPLTAEGTETLSKPDTMTGKRLARRVAYVGAAKVATVVLADGDNLITHADLSGDAVEFNSIGLYPRILRGTAVIIPEWSVEQGDKLLIKSAVAGDALHVCQYDVISERAVRNAVEPLVAPVGSQAFEALRRSYAEAGYNLVDGSFETGGTLSSATDVLLHNVTVEAYAWTGAFPHVVAPGTDPTAVGSGYIPRTDVVLRADLANDTDPAQGADLVGYSGGTVAEKLGESISVADYLSAAGGNPVRAITLAVAAAYGRPVYCPAKYSYTLLATEVLSFLAPVTLIGDPPSYDPATGVKRGTWINGVCSASGDASHVTMINIGFDSRGSNTAEGLVIASARGNPQIDNVYLDNVMVVTDQDSNHCILIENARYVKTGFTASYGGIQGLAVKAEDCELGDHLGVDQTTWALTIRYSPTIPCRRLTHKSLNAIAVNRAKGGGCIVMNDQEGAAVDNIHLGVVRVVNGAAGFYWTNHGNTVRGNNVTIDDLQIEGASDFAIQTFGIPRGLKIRSGYLKNCAGSIYTNGGDARDFVIGNLSLDNTPVPASLSGDGHIVHGWRRIGDTGVSTFVQNASTNLQHFNMDQRVSAVANISGGTVLGGGVVATTFPANGNLTAAKYYPGVRVQKSVASVATNGTVDLYTLPTGGQIYCVEMHVVALTVAGVHTRHVSISNGTLVYLSSSHNASSVFEIQVVGGVIQLKYLFSPASSVDVNAVLNIMKNG